MIKTAAGATAMTVLGIPLAGKGTELSADKAVKGKKKILVIGAHPDDPETCAGGTMCLLLSGLILTTRKPAPAAPCACFPRRATRW